MRRNCKSSFEDLKWNTFVFVKKKCSFVNKTKRNKRKKKRMFRRSRIVRVPSPFFHESFRLPDPIATNSWANERYGRNIQITQEVDDKIKSLVNQIATGFPDGEKARQLHISRGKLLARDRVKNLLDENSDFLELSPLAAYDLYPKDYPACAGIICGIGKIAGIRCMIMANDATVKGGTYYPVTAKKQLRAQKIAQQNHLPCVYLVDSGGGNLERQAEGFADEQHFGRLFYNQANMSSLGIPQVSCVMGSCTAGGAYIPCMSDETIIVKGVGTIFLGGPLLVQAATGEMNTPEDLGGGFMHCTKSGTADNLADDDRHGLVLTRRVVQHLNRRRQKTVVQEFDDLKAHQKFEEPVFGIEDISGFVDPPFSSHPSETLTSFVNTQGVIARITDGSCFDEFKGLYGPELTCGFAFIEGIEVGIVADDGSTLSAGAGLKGTHFVQMCAQRKLPVVFLQGGGCFASGVARTSETATELPEASAKHAAKFISSVATTSANVPKITVVLRGCISDGAFAMCGRSMEPRFMFMWPTAQTSMASDALTNPIPEAKTHCNSALFSSARIFDDGIISPSQTRSVIAEALRCCLCQETEKNVAGSYGVFRM